VSGWFEGKDAFPIGQSERESWIAKMLADGRTIPGGYTWSGDSLVAFFRLEDGTVEIFDCVLRRTKMIAPDKDKP
jgi:hypothetical protein